MDYVSSLLPFDQNTDDLFEPFSFPDFSPDELLFALSDDFDTDNLLMDQSQDLGAVISSGSKRKTAEISTTGVNKDDQNQNKQNQNQTHDSKKKKIIHRDLERQRRQEMSSLYSSLKALLPPEYLKGKRSTSDHMNQTINYIKDQKNKIKVLTDKKTTLMSTSCSSSSFVVVPPPCSEGCLEDSVVVRPCVWGAMEVVISTALTQSLPLSGVLRALIREGLTIVHCISTKADQKLLHTIVSEVSDGRVIDPFQLLKKLEEFAMHSSRVDYDFEPQID